MSDTFQIDWEKTPLLPAVAQEAGTNEVLMLAYMDKEALELTLSTGYAHYFSRSRQRIWKKGESSGHVQKVKEVWLDCDGDTLLVKVEQEGAACHTGRPTCFFQRIDTGEVTGEAADLSGVYGVVDRLYHTLLERKGADPASSYVAKLYSKGDNAILKKVVEEAGEFAFAVKDNDEKEIVYEGADLLFHALVALAHKGISPDRIRQELARREGLSGIEEKNSRKQ